MAGSTGLHRPQTCRRGPLLHQAVTCVGRTRGGQFCSLCVLHGLRGPGWLVSWWRGRWAGTQGTTGRAAGLGGFFQSSVTPSSRARRLTQCPPYPLSPSGIPWASPPAGPSSPSCPRPRAERGWICPRAGGVWEGVGPVCHIQPGGYCPFVGVARGWRLVSLGKHHRRGSLDTRSLSSDGSGGWKSKINVPTGLFPLRPFSLQVDGRYPLFS